MPDWPHSPVHRLSERGAYMVTSGTYHRELLLNSHRKLTFFQDCLFDISKEFGWNLQAWAVMGNHFHFIASSPENPGNLRTFISKLHTLTSKKFNEMDNSQGRRVWYQYYDSHITYPQSYFARLKYVHNNPAHHGIVPVSEEYDWCSAAWFKRTSDKSFAGTVESFKTDNLNVYDDF
ncbi:MAG TPA: hypothetical protein DCZ94_16635 [Lentisphaeria bacterium]|nr:MAG: hypothetical protein A2X48_00165 [Lentisphaerae bacterium GWF2_49_21]HBC88575.1 hypothetical protein [Lentisphaeria bacterium]